MTDYTWLVRVDNLSLLAGIFIGFFSLLTMLYSIGFVGTGKKTNSYYIYVILTALFSIGAVFANNLLLLIVCWGLLGMLLYLLIGQGTSKRSSYTAKKTFIIIGGTDALMLMGIAIVWKITGSLQMDNMMISLSNRPAVLAYLCLAIGAFAKAGAMPLHTWVPDTAEDAPTPVTAFLPASLDKILGIYLLARISLGMFIMDSAMNTFLMALGSFTIVAAVMMALVQHDLKRLLGYHAVSQVGYMILGIGTGNPIGIAAGLFHLINNAIYKSCLFFTGGAVEKKAGTTDLDKLGGLIKFMPISFATFLVASLAISGVPPFNGFASKWMLYQGIIETARSGGYLWIIWLVAAMFGSALTLASFMKLLHAIFLGQPSDNIKQAGSRLGEVGPAMWVPSVILAGLCVVFGVFAYKIPLGMFIIPSIGRGLSYPGIWSPGLATWLLLGGIFIGIMIYLLGTAVKTRQVDAFVGGEDLENQPDMRVSGTGFYNSIQDIGVLRWMYNMAEKKNFDIYDIGTRITFGFNSLLRHLHNGVLPTYLAWCILGMAVLFFVLLR